MHSILPPIARENIWQICSKKGLGLPTSFTLVFFSLSSYSLSSGDAAGKEGKSSAWMAAAAAKGEKGKGKRKAIAHPSS